MSLSDFDEPLRITLNFIVLSLMNTTVFISLFGPLLFNIAFARAQNQSNDIVRSSAQNGDQDSLPQGICLLAETKEGNPEYSLMEFSVHYYTLIAALFALIVASWGLVLWELPPNQTAFLAISNDSFKLWSALVAILITLASLIILLSGYCGRSSVIESYQTPKQERVSILGQTLPPFNVITVLRIVTAVLGAGYVWVAITVVKKGIF